MVTAALVSTCPRKQAHQQTGCSGAAACLTALAVGHLILGVEVPGVVCDVLAAAAAAVAAAADYDLQCYHTAAVAAAAAGTGVAACAAHCVYQAAAVAWPVQACAALHAQVRVAVCWGSHAAAAAAGDPAWRAAGARGS
eukprot:1158484-Pelagomonas_calceolata.AAC.12